MSYQPPPYDARNPDQLAELRAALAGMKDAFLGAAAERDALRAEVERLKAEAQKAVCVYCGESFDKCADGTILEHIVSCEKRADKYELLLRRAEATLAEREAEIAKIQAENWRVLNEAELEFVRRAATARAEALEEAAERLKDWDRNGAAAGAIRALASDTKGER